MLKVTENIYILRNFYMKEGFSLHVLLFVLQMFKAPAS